MFLIKRYIKQILLSKMKSWVILGKESKFILIQFQPVVLYYFVIAIPSMERIKTKQITLRNVRLSVNFAFLKFYSLWYKNWILSLYQGS